MLYNAAMKKGMIKEESTVKISITAKRAREEIDFEEVRKLLKLMEKKRRTRVN